MLSVRGLAWVGVLGCVLSPGRAEALNLLENGSASDSSDFGRFWSSTGAAGVHRPFYREGALCAEVTGATAYPYDVQLTHRGFFQQGIPSGSSGNLRFLVSADQPLSVRVKIGLFEDPYTEFYSQEAVSLSGSLDDYTAVSRVGITLSGTSEFALQIGAAATPPYTVCVKNLVFEDPSYFPTQAPRGIMVNQLGYLPGLPRYAMMGVGAAEPERDFVVVDADDVTVLSGRTSGATTRDADSGQYVHRIDLGELPQGSNYVVKVDMGDYVLDSYRFDVRHDLYAALRRDALRFFYFQRSGQALEATYTERGEWVHGAGHPGDASVPCFRYSSEPSDYCPASRDVSGGWYDAGDYGKYVVNGGISVWTLLAAFERERHLGAGSPFSAIADVNIPESGDDVPDLLDEVRHELEFFLKMQIPTTESLGGLVHHKVHDDAWTAAYGVDPATDSTPRILLPPSTAATLNFAAALAQASRVYRDYDAAFADHCLAQARVAYAAAAAHPNLLYPSGGFGESGGGDYNDATVTDEFYWAAAELLAATGEQEFLSDVLASPHHLQVPGMSWGYTSALGVLTLATGPDGVPDDLRCAARDAVVASGEQILGVVAAQDYRVPLADDGSEYYWGSNSNVLNYAIVMGYAHAFASGATRTALLGGVEDAMSYVLGRNVRGTSYVSGHGENPMLYPHHRFFSHMLSAWLGEGAWAPPPPPGILAGGPNSSSDDPYVETLYGKPCSQAPASCYADHADSFSTNEVTVNWNAPLFFVAALLDDAANDRIAEPDSECDTGGSGGSGGTSSSGGGAGEGAATGSAGDSDPGGSGGTAANGSGATGGNGQSGTPGSGATTATGGTDITGASGEGGADDADDDRRRRRRGDDGGCGCRLESSPTSQKEAFGLLAGLLLAAGRRWRRRR